MKIRKMIYRVEGDPDIRTREGHVVDYMRKKWLVVEWRKSQTEGKITPARMVCLDGLEFQQPDDSLGWRCYTLRKLLSPQMVDDGRIVSQDQVGRVMVNVPLFVEESDLDSHSYVP